MLEFSRVGVSLGARFGVPQSHGVMVLEPGVTPVLRVITPIANETVRLGLGASAASVLDFAVQGSARVAVTVGGVAGSLPVDLIAAARLPGAGSVTGFLSPVPSWGQAVELLAVQAGGVPLLIATRPGGAGVEVFRIGAGESLTRLGGVSDGTATALAGVTALASVTVGAQVFVYAGSGAEHGVTAMTLSSAGALTVVGSAGAAQGVPMQGVTALEAFSHGGQPWLVAGAAGSSSLTLFRIGPDGVPVAVDHVFDEL
ncbi:MAG: hypothetical protein RLZZ563_654, partial [Pseudomonadota bacterium]